MAFKVLPAFLILSLTWTACQNDSSPSGATQNEAAPAEMPAATAADAPADVAGSDAAIPMATPGDAAAAVPASASGDAAKSSGKVNPPHGQPGHRCDIAVGAPLDGSPAASKPAATAKPAATPTPVTTTPKPAATPAGSATTVAPGTNPPHGQPGHRCDIAVGAPLDSKPKQ